MQNTTYELYQVAACHALHYQQHGLGFKAYESFLVGVDPRYRDLPEAGLSQPPCVQAWHDVMRGASCK